MACLDPTPGGVVAHGESYEETNSREIMEEMGISGAEQTHLFTFYYEDDRLGYGCETSGLFHPPPWFCTGCVAGGMHGSAFTMDPFDCSR